MLVIGEALEHDAGVGDDALWVAPEDVVLKQVGINGAFEPRVVLRYVGEEGFVEVGPAE